jgi:preprotein translocase subunit YajC
MSISLNRSFVIAAAAPEFCHTQNKDEAEAAKPMHANPNDGKQGNNTGAPGGPGAPPGPAADSNPLGGLWIPLLLMFAVMYFVILRPERKRQKAAAELRSNLKKGDKVLLASGMFGTVAAIGDDSVVVEIADKVRVQFQKSSITQVVENKEKAEAAAPAK